MPRRHTPAADPTRAVAYIRCSTSRQDLSPDAQRQAIDAWAAEHGVQVFAVHEDLAVSGGAELDQRPGLVAAIDALPAHGAGLLVVAKRDRLARDVLTTALVERLCERHGARVASADGAGNGDGPEAALMRNIVSAFAAYERMIIKARTKAALAVKRARGERVGGVPYGYRAVDGRLEPDDAEGRAVERARQLRGEGQSLRTVAATLIAEGHRPRNGGNWAIQTVKRLTTV